MADAAKQGSLISEPVNGESEPAGRAPTIHVEGDAFAILPEWVLLGGFTDKALRIYGLLALHASGKARSAYPSLRRLAQLAGCHTRTVQRALRELEAAGAIKATARFSGGRQTSTVYRVYRDNPVGRGGAHVTPGVAPMSPREPDSVNQRVPNGTPDQESGDLGSSLNGRVKALVSRFSEAFERTTGVAYEPKRMDYLHANKLLRAYGDDEVEGVCVMAFEKAEREPWWAENISLPLIHSRYRALRLAIAQGGR